MNHHIVPLEKIEYAGVMEKLPPQCRFINVEEWKFEHFWLYSPNGDVLIFTTEPITNIDHMKVNNASQS